jgi:predicted O-linked N-acetylglucosamine transferase (SPINDLY family)
VQVQWLGYPGTMGASWIDYVIADRILIPPGHELHFSEKVIRLPDTYQPSDDKRPIGEPRTRTDHGLPDDAFVFCSFNQVFKITPEVFSVWMELLKAVDHSVLWFLTPAQAASEALLREAANRGVNPARIVFAPRLPIPEHAARLVHADLALDCFPYGSHTTASDVLRAGVPLVALAGETFASRVSASILTAAGLPELTTTSLDDYRELALMIATDRERLALLKSRVRNECRASALFDTQRFTRNLEKAYLAAWNRYESGQPPDHIDVS